MAAALVQKSRSMMRSSPTGGMEVRLDVLATPGKTMGSSVGSAKAPFAVSSTRWKRPSGSTR